MSRYYVFETTMAAGGATRIWTDGRFRRLRLLDDATFARLEPIWKARSALLPMVMAPAAALIIFMLALGELAESNLFLIILAALAIDLTARAVLGYRERDALAGTTTWDIPADTSAAMRQAADANDLDTVLAAAISVATTDDGPE